MLPDSPWLAASAAGSGLHKEGWTPMASNGKKKTTMAKLTRESRLRERRADKQAKKDARKRTPAHDQNPASDLLSSTDSELPLAQQGARQPARATLAHTLADA
jgi:hypothetical protein